MCVVLGEVLAIADRLYGSGEERGNFDTRLW
jgi:hypothetical protein